MKSWKAALFVAVLLLFPSALCAQCPEQGGLYEEYRVAAVRVELPLRIPIGWLESSLLGKLPSHQNLLDRLPIQMGKPFHLLDHVATLAEIRDYYTLLNPGQKVRVVAVYPRFENCDDKARSVTVIYRVYSIDAAYYATRIFEAVKTQAADGLHVPPKATGSTDRIFSPLISYNASKRLSVGARSAWAVTSPLLNRIDADFEVSRTSNQAGLAFSGSRNPVRSTFSHLDWRIGFNHHANPAGNLRLKDSTAYLQFFAATRARGPLAFIGRSGASMESGNRQSDGVIQPLNNAPHRVVKFFVGGSWNYWRQDWKASYGIQRGFGTESTAVNYTKQIVDLGYAVRWLRQEYRPIRIESRLTAGWIRGGDARIPVSERFFGGNVSRNFIDGALWQIRSAPFIRSIPENRWITTKDGTLGGNSFAALNVTASWTVNSKPAMPPEVRFAKEVGDTLSFALQKIRMVSLEDYRAGLPEFNPIFNTLPELDRQLERIAAILLSLVPEGDRSPLGDSIRTQASIVEELAAGTQRSLDAGKTGGAWTTIFLLAHDNGDSLISDLADLEEELTTADRLLDAAKIKQVREEFETIQMSLPGLLTAVNDIVWPAGKALDSLNPRIDALRLLTESVSEKLNELPEGSMEMTPLVNDAKVRVAAVLTQIELPLDTDRSARLFNLERLSLGVGELVPPQLLSAGSSLNSLADRLRQEGKPDEAGGFQLAATAMNQAQADIAAELRRTRLPKGERWARSQNSYVERALDVAFRELSLISWSPVLMFDAARIGPAAPGYSPGRYGIGGGLRLSVVSFDVTLGYSWNPKPQVLEKHGAVFFSMEVSDLF